MSTRLTVTGTAWVTPVVRRVHFRSDDLSAFAGSVQTDRYVKIVFPKPGVEYPEPLDIRALRGTIPPEHMPDVRTYTAIFPDVDAGDPRHRLRRARRRGRGRPVGRARASRATRCWSTVPVAVIGPIPRPTGTCSSATSRPCPRSPPRSTCSIPGATARVVLLVDRPGHEPVLPLPENATVTHVYRSDAGGDDTDGPLVRAVRAMEWPDGRVHAFVHGEAQETMHGLRPLLLKERGLARDQLSVSGYWRRGRTEDGFRVWKSELAQAEASGAELARSLAGTAPRPPRHAENGDPMADSPSESTTSCSTERPYRVLSGAIHYFRVHPDQWARPHPHGAADGAQHDRDLRGVERALPGARRVGHERRARPRPLPRRGGGRGHARDRAPRSLHLRRVAQRRAAGLAHRRCPRRGCAAPSRRTWPR